MCESQHAIYISASNVHTHTLKITNVLLHVIESYLSLIIKYIYFLTYVIWHMLLLHNYVISVYIVLYPPPLDNCRFLNIYHLYIK